MSSHNSFPRQQRRREGQLSYAKLSGGGLKSGILFLMFLSGIVFCSKMKTTV